VCDLETTKILVNEEEDRVNRPGRGVDHPTPSSAEIKERVELYLHSSSGPSWDVVG